ncbi:hypothetical protein Tco_0441944 [Tanacetum coccineum]
MITTTGIIEDKNLLGLILPKDTMETFLCVQDAPCITQEIALSNVGLATKWGHHDQKTSRTIRSNRYELK